MNFIRRQLPGNAMHHFVKNRRGGNHFRNSALEINKISYNKLCRCLGSIGMNAGCQPANTGKETVVEKAGFHLRAVIHRGKRDIDEACTTLRSCGKKINKAVAHGSI